MNINRNPKSMQSKSKTHEITKIDENKYEVFSSRKGNTYLISLLSNGGASCTCDWATKRHHENGNVGCSHTIAVFDFIAKENGAKSVSAWASEEEANRQHRKVTDIGDGLIITTRSA